LVVWLDLGLCGQPCIFFFLVLIWLQQPCFFLI
jgi:hypothetical protein